jgi:hypothetical protein
VRAANARLQHPAAPYRHASLGGVSLNQSSLGVSAHPTEFDVDDATRPKLKRLSRIEESRDRFIETDCRLYLALKLRVIHKIARHQGLFDHQQIELIHLFHHRYVIERVSGVGIDAQPYRGIPGADGSGQLDILSGLDLELDSLITAFYFGSHFFKKLFGAFLKPYRNAAVYLFLTPAQMPPQRAIVEARFQIPDSRLDSALSHAIAAYARKRAADILGFFNSRGGKHGGDEMGDDYPRRIDGFVIEERVFRSGAFAVSDDALFVEHADDHNAPPRSPSETGLERISKRQFDFSQFYFFKL